MRSPILDGSGFDGSAKVHSIPHHDILGAIAIEIEREHETRLRGAGAKRHAASKRDRRRVLRKRVDVEGEWPHIVVVGGHRVGPVDHTAI